MDNQNSFVMYVSSTTGIATIQMVMSDDLIQLFIDVFQIELELMQGTAWCLPNGQCGYDFKVEDRAKVDMLIKFSKLLCSSPKMTTTIMGVPINPN